MTAKEFYNSKAIKHQLKRAIKHDKAYFESAIIELMEQYAQSQVNKNGIFQDVTDRAFIAEKGNERIIVVAKDVFDAAQMIENSGNKDYEMFFRPHKCLLPCR